MLEVILDPTVRELFQASLLGFLGSQLGDLAFTESKELPGVDVVTRFSRRGVAHGVLALKFSDPEQYAREVAMLSGGYQELNGDPRFKNLGAVIDLNELASSSAQTRSDVIAATTGAAVSRLLSGLLVITEPDKTTAPANLLVPIREAGFGKNDLIVVPAYYQSEPALGAIAANQLLQSGLK